MILVNDIVNNGTSFSEDIFTKGVSIYEVIRIFKGHPIFLKDNIIYACVLTSVWVLIES